MSYWRHWILMLSFAFCLSCDAQPDRVAILGESFSSENGSSGINEEILKRLFLLIRNKDPEAVIFTGNMTLGLERIPGKGILEGPLKYPLAPIEIGSDQERWPRIGYRYSSSNFQKQITNFISLKNSQLGIKIPFYPILGKHDVFGPDAANIVIKAFNLKNEAPEKASVLGYTVVVNNALFILFSNARYNPQTQSVTEHALNDQLLDWLRETLKKERNKYSFTFVVGNEPAFSTTSSFGFFQGLDKDAQYRDRFWKILLEHQVTAYFCSGERLYDRTNRYGIWQVMSGGAGAPLYKREFDKAFYHFLLLTIPSSANTVPKVQVFDSHGNLVDEFDLTPSRYPVYQLRIS